MRFEDVGPWLVEPGHGRTKFCPPRLVHFTERDVPWQYRKGMQQQDAGHIPAMSPYGRHSFGEFSHTVQSKYRGMVEQSRSGLLIIPSFPPS